MDNKIAAIVVIILSIIGIAQVAEYFHSKVTIQPPPFQWDDPSVKIQDQNGLIGVYHFGINTVSVDIPKSGFEQTTLTGHWEGQTFVVDRQGPHEYKLKIHSNEVEWTEDETLIPGKKYKRI